MLVFDRGKFLSGIFTLIKLSVAVAILVVLGTKFLDLWQTQAEQMPEVGLLQEAAE